MKGNKLSVLITGASTGIGRACALYLDNEGYKVYAGVRNSEDFDSLLKAGSDRIQPVILDVCEDEDVENTLRTILKDKDNTLFGLVNNAGIGISGLIEATPMTELKRIFEVNFFGLHRVSQAFLPLIRKNKGRIVNIGSSSSFMSGPALGPYSASKFALRSYNDALRIEMKTFGVHVSLIAPGPVESAIWEKAIKYKEEIRKKISPELLRDYDMFVKAGDALFDNIKPIPTYHVVNAVHHALTSKKPKNVYLIGKNAVLARIFSSLPKKWSDSLFLDRIRKAAGSS
ncbi:MAG: SDR family oxidoreductase [Cyclobacteriaceae bacterium]|jgi:short-subunit dehydrogenase